MYLLNLVMMAIESSAVSVYTHQTVWRHLHKTSILLHPHSVHCSLLLSVQIKKRYAKRVLSPSSPSSCCHPITASSASQGRLGLWFTI